MKASDNIYPKVIHSMQTADQAAPSDSSWKTYAKADGIYARSSNGIVGPFGSGTNFTAAGSNSKDVSGRSYAGASTTLLAPFDHEHLGVAAITSSSSNTLQRPTVNLRAGTNIGFALSDTDGTGTFDTLTITGTVGGGGSGTQTAYWAAAFNNANQTVNNAVVLLNSERYDANGMHSTVSNTSRMTIPSDGGGVYHVIGNFLDTSSGGSDAKIRVNGTEVVGASQTGAQNITQQVTAIVSVVAGDYIELYLSTAGGNHTIFGHATDGAAASLQVIRIGT